MKGKVLLGGLAAIGVPLAVFLSGPRPSKKIELREINLPIDLDEYINRQEAEFADITPGAEKLIRWATPEKKKTAVSIVYIHGFSATRQEVHPLCDVVADSLGANVFYARLKGHGRSDDAMREPTAEDWVNDTREALEIGRRLGDKVVLVGTSTGATLTTWLKLQSDTSDILASVMISPNYAPNDPNAGVALWPWGENIMRLAVGDMRSWEPANDLQEKYWNTTYPVSSVVPMMTLVDIVDEADLGAIVTPTLVIYSKLDEVISVEKIEQKFELMGSPVKQLVEIDTTGDGSNHVLAGDIVSPNTTLPVSRMILDFLQPLL